MWGTSLYANDTSSDVRDLVRGLARLPWPAERILSSILERCPAAADDSAEDYPDIWLALADQFHEFGMLNDAVRVRALDIVHSGLDLELKKQLGLSERDVRTRSAALQKLAEKLARSNPKPKPRKTLSAPEPAIFQPGTIVCYPTEQGAPINPWFSSAVISRDFTANGWGTAVVLTVGHYEGYVPWYGMGRLAAHGRHRPSFEECLASGIESEPNWANETGKGTLAIAKGSLPPAIGKKMSLEVLGSLEFDPRRIAKQVPASLEAPGRLFANLNTLFLRWRSKDFPLFADEADLPLPKVILSLSSLAGRS